MIVNSNIKEELVCYHCGDVCFDDNYADGEKHFCCMGCKTVYEILNANNLCTYYKLDEKPGVSRKGIEDKRFDYLDEPEVIAKLINFKDDKITAVSFYIPQMHCSSCIWLLENLYKLNPAVVQSRTNFLKKELTLKFFHDKVSLKEVVQLISSIGYEPYISLEHEDQDSKSASQQTYNKKLYYRFGIAAFCFGNIMLLSFPEYLSIDVNDTFYRKVFSGLSFILSLPVFFYSSSEYFISAYRGLKKKIINIDFPLSLGIIALFVQSVYEVLSRTGAGYFDSLAGLLFFLLLGKIFQNKSYKSLDFDRSYRSYFPLSVLVKKDGKELSTSIKNLRQRDRIIIRNNEIIPADAVLLKGSAAIDYSFVTGESRTVSITEGELVYAGGRQIGSAIELEVVKEISQSYLTQLWNNDAFKKEDDNFFTHFSNTLSKYFTLVILAIALLSFLWMLQYGMGIAVKVFTSVLIVACPCALAMSTPFTLGNALRIYGRNKFYLKNIKAVETLSRITDIVFDKTGTITESGNSKIEFSGGNLSEHESALLKSLTRNSTHPLSKQIFGSLNAERIFPVIMYDEIPNAGVEGVVCGSYIKLGSRRFVSVLYNPAGKSASASRDDGSKVYISIDGVTRGYFNISNRYRNGFEGIIKKLKRNYKLSLLSGDNESERETLSEHFGDKENLYFRQSPGDKLSYVKQLQSAGKNVLMIGDGLNDAGALSQSDAGVAVTDDIGVFSPACDGILDASGFNKLPAFLSFAKISRNIIILSFTISFIYNIIGLGFAVQGLLSPIVAAVLMPVSSVSVVVFATLSTRLMAKRKGL